MVNEEVEGVAFYFDCDDIALTEIGYRAVVQWWWPLVLSVRAPEFVLTAVPGEDLKKVVVSLVSGGTEDDAIIICAIVWAMYLGCCNRKTEVAKLIALVEGYGDPLCRFVLDVVLSIQEEVGATYRPLILIVCQVIGWSCGGGRPCMSLRIRKCADDVYCDYGTDEYRQQ